MNREKQKEKVKIISDICPFYKEYGTCEQCNTELDIDDPPCYFECIADHIIRCDYRKQSEVAREIFEEIERIFDGKKYVPYPLYEIAELKKKYTERKDTNERSDETDTESENT